MKITVKEQVVLDGETYPEGTHEDIADAVALALLETFPNKVKKYRAPAKKKKTVKRVTAKA